MAKTKNKSIRFDVDHLKYAFEKTGLTKEQELVDKVLADLYAAGNMSENLFIGKKNTNEFKKTFSTPYEDLAEVLDNGKEDAEPVRQAGESSVDFAARKNDWKARQRSKLK